MDINTIREKYPQYSDLSDEALVNGLHKKYYSDIPVNEFYGKVGFKSETAEPKGTVTLEQPNLYKEIPNIPPETTEKGKGVGIADTLSKVISSPLSFLTGEDYSKDLETPVVGSLAKGVVGAKTGLVQNKLATLMELREADIRSYGPNFERAPEDKLSRIQERESAIQGYMQDLANYGMQNKEIETKYGKPEISKRLDEITSKPEYKDASFAAKTGLYLGEIVKNPSEIPSYIANIGLESLPQTATIVAAAYASKLGGISPGGRAAAAGGVSAFNEFGGQYAELRTQGMGHEEAWQKAAAKSGVIGLFDAVSFKSAGKAAESLLNTTAKKAPAIETVKTLGKETGKQAGYGAAGEGLGAYTIGQPLDPRAMGEEALGEMAGAPAAAATTYAKERIEAVSPTTAQLAPEWVKDEKGNLVQKPITPEVPETPVTLEPPQQQLGLFAPEELPIQVDQSALTEKQRAESEVERNIFALQQQEQTPEIKQQIASLQEQLPKGPGVTLDTLQEEHSALGRAYTALDEQKATLVQQRNAVPKLDDKLPITEQIKNIEAQQAKIAARSEEIGIQGDKLAKQIAPVEKTGQRELKPVSPIVGSVISKFGLAPKAPIRNAIKNLDMTDPADRATFIDEINKHVIKKAKIDMKAVENYLSYFEETPSEPTTNIPGAVEPSVPVPAQRMETAQGVTAPIAGGVESDIGATVGIAGGEAPASTPKQGALTPDYGRAINPNTLEVLQQPPVSFGDLPSTIQRLERNIYTLRQQEQTPEVVQQVEVLQTQLESAKQQQQQGAVEEPNYNYGRAINPNTTEVLQQPPVSFGTLVLNATKIQQDVAALQQQKQTPEVKQQIYALQAQLSLPPFVAPAQLQLQNDVVHNNLSTDEKQTLAKEYGQDEYNEVAKNRFVEDFIKAITQGYNTVSKEVAKIIKRIQAAILAAAIVMNPINVSPPVQFGIPTQTITTEVKANLPAEVTNMSEAGQQVYATVLPAIQKELQDKNKFFIITDKPTATTFIFNPDGSLLLSKKVLVGKSFGDIYKGNNKVDSNKITPAGLFDLGLRQYGESGSGEYDTGKIFVLDKAIDGKYSITIMHSVWEHETDAQMRTKALQKEGAEDSRYSFGCINVDKETYKYLVDNHLQQMDGSKIFIVPDNQATVEDVISAKIGTEDVSRQATTPVTKTTNVPGRGTVPASSTDQLAIRREDSKTSMIKKLKKPNGFKTLTPLEIAELKELFGEDATKSIALLRSGLTLDDVMKALGIKTPVTPTPEGKSLLANLAAAGGAKPSKSPSGWFTEEVEEADKAFLGNTMGDKVKNYTGLSNILSFDDSFMNKMRDGLLELGAQGKVVMKDAVDALRRLEITQVLYRGQLATEAINKGKLVYEADSNRYHVEDDPDNMNAIRDELQKLSSRVGVTADKALEIASKGFEANRIQDVYDKMNKDKGEITRTEKKIEDLQRIKQRTKAEQKDLNTKKALLKNLKDKVQMYEGQTQHMSRKEAQEGMAIYNGTPEVKEIARIWQVMRERVVAELVRSGVTSEEKAERWLDEMAYVPFFRTIEEQKTAGTHIMKKGLGESMKEYAFEGSMLPVENTIGNMYQWMQWSYARAISNQHQQVALDQMRAVFPDMVKDGKHPKGNTIVIYKDGTRREYSIANPLIAQYFQGVGNMVFGTKSVASQYANLFTKGITLTPGFSATQLILKDTYEAMHTSGVKNPYGIILNIFTEMAKTALNTSEARKELISRGQLTTREHAMAAAHDADIATKLEVKEAAVHRKVISILGKMSALSDNMLRQAVYQQLINEGVGKDEAADRATEIFNYRRASGSTTMQFVNNYVPFMNAFTVSTRVAMRTVSGKGISAQTRADGLSTLAGATILIGVGNLIYMNLVGDEDEYKRMNRFRRDKSYVIPGTGLSVPLREGWFIMDKLAAEYAYNLAENSAITDKQMFKDAMKKAAIQQITPPIGGVFTAPIGVALNKDIYANRDIVNKAQEKILPEYQFNKSTSEISKVIGKETGYSPLKIDYFLKTFFGGYMGTMATITNSAIADMRNKPRPAEENENITASALGFSSFISKQGTPNVVPDLYRAAHEVDNILPTVKSLARTDKEEARRLIEEKRNDIRIGAGTAALEKTFAALNRQESIIREMKSTDRLKDGRLATREVKKELIDKINLERESLMPKVMEARKKVFEK